MVSPGVAVIVPVFNRVNLVIEALDSIAAQTRAPDRLVIVDDGSTDGSGDAVGAWLARAKPGFPATFIRQANLGAPAARNRAIREAGDCGLIAFLDSDDLWPPDYLARMADAAAADTRAVAFSCDQREHDVAAEQWRDVPAAGYNGMITGQILLFGMPLPSCTVVRADAFHRAGGFNESYRKGLEDVELFLCISVLGPWRSVPGAPVVRRTETRGSCGGPDQLSIQHTQRPDAARAALAVYERFLFELGGAAALPASVWRPALARRWRNEAGKARARGDLALAAEGYRRAWRYRLGRVDWLIKSMLLGLRSLRRRARD